jgi:hypothetical protein
LGAWKNSRIDPARLPAIFGVAMKPTLAASRFCGLIVLFAAALAPRAMGQAALSFASPGSEAYLDSSTRLIGWKFTVTQQVDVLALGWFDWQQDGLSLAHEVGIWDQANTTTPLASLTIASGTAATLSGYFRYANLGSPLTLQAGNTYTIAGLDVGAGGDAHTWDIILGSFENKEVVAFDRDPRVATYSGGAFGDYAASFGYPTGYVPDGRSVLMGPNFIMAAVPEPATNALLMAVATLGTVMLARVRRTSGKA